MVEYAVHLEDRLLWRCSLPLLSAVVLQNTGLGMDIEFLPRRSHNTIATLVSNLSVVIDDAVLLDFEFQPLTEVMTGEGSQIGFSTDFGVNLIPRLPHSGSQEPTQNREVGSNVTMVVRLGSQTMDLFHALGIVEEIAILIGFGEFLAVTGELGLGSTTRFQETLGHVFSHIISFGTGIYADATKKPL
jgi:hypothetical protein